MVSVEEGQDVALQFTCEDHEVPGTCGVGGALGGGTRVHVDICCPFYAHTPVCVISVISLHS